MQISHVIRYSGMTWGIVFISHLPFWLMSTILFTLKQYKNLKLCGFPACPILVFVMFIEIAMTKVLYFEMHGRGLGFDSGHCFYE